MYFGMRFLCIEFLSSCLYWPELIDIALVGVGKCKYSLQCVEQFHSSLIPKYCSSVLGSIDMKVLHSFCLQLIVFYRIHLIIVKKGFAMAASKRYSEQWNIWAYYINPWGCTEKYSPVHLPVHPSKQCEFITFPEFTAVRTDWLEGVNFPGLHEWTTMLIMVGPWIKLSANAVRYRPIRTGIGVYQCDAT